RAFCTAAAPRNRPIDRAPAAPHGESIQDAHSKAKAERNVGNAEPPQVQPYGPLFSAVAGAATVVRAYPCRVASLAKAAFFVSLVPQFGFSPLRPLRVETPHSFRIFPTPGLWRGPQRCGRASLTSRLHRLGDRRCKRAPSNGSIQLKATGSFGPRAERRTSSSTSRRSSALVSARSTKVRLSSTSS